MCRRFALLFSIAAASFSMAGGVASAGPLTILQFGQANAQTQVDVDHSYFWSFEYSGSTAYSPISAKFDMKRGPQTTEDITMELWQADPITGFSIAKLAFKTLTPGDFTQSFKTVEFQLFNTDTVLPPRFNVTLKSPAADVQSQAYFIKGRLADATFTFDDGSGQAPSGFKYDGFGNGDQGGTPTPPVPPAPVPEPSTYLAQAGVVLALAMFRKFRRKSVVA
jgi:hypothetical protein